MNSRICNKLDRSRFVPEMRAELEENGFIASLRCCYLTGVIVMNSPEGYFTATMAVVRSF